MLVAAVLLTAGCEPEPDKPEQLISQAQLARQKGDHKVAIIRLLNVAKVSPDDARVRYLLGLSYSDDGQFAPALIELRKAVKLNYDRAKVMPAIGKSLLAMKEYDKLLNEVRSETEGDNHTRAKILTLRALAYLGLYRVAEGRDLLAQALELEPEFSDALVGQALLEGAERKFDVASSLVDRAIASAPRNLDAWLLRGDLDRVLERDSAAAYRKVIGIDPKNVLARVNLVSMQVAAGKYDDARVLLGELHKLAPDDPIVSYMEGLIEFRRADYIAARDWAVRALKVAPRHIPTLLLAGATEFALGNCPRAQSYLASVVERVPESLYARKLLVMSLKGTGQTLQARDVLRSGLFYAPNDIDLLVLAGEVEMQANDLAAARGYFEKAVKLDPKSASARTGFAVSRLAGGETDRALADLETAVALDSRLHDADVLLVVSQLQRAHYDQALKALQTLENKQPTNPLTYNLKGAVYLAKSDIASARKYFKQALELQPTYLPAAQNLAQLYITDGKPRMARKLLEDIVATNDNHVDALLALAELGPRIGASGNEQVDWLQRARVASPSMVRPALMLARFYSRSGQADKALEVISGAQANDRNNVELLDALGAAQIAAGEKQKALETYAKVVTLQPKSAAARYRLASVQTVNSDTPGAVLSLRKALELQPDYIDAQAALVGLEIRAKRFVEAKSIARHLQKRAAGSPIGFVLEGDVLVAEKKFLPAAKLYEMAYGIGARGAIAMKLHAAYTVAGKPDDADKRLAQWLNNSPDDVVARRYAADAALKAGGYGHAIEQYEWLLRKQPDNAILLNNLAMAYWQEKDTSALGIAEHAYRLRPENPEIADTVGWMLVEQGDAARGVDVLQKVVAAAPGKLSARYHLAYGWFKVGDIARARNELKTLLSSEMSFPERGDAASLSRQLH